MLKVYNTLTKKKEEFKPLKAGEVGIYVCGVTPYNHPHIAQICVHVVLILCPVH